MEFHSENTTQNTEPAPADHRRGNLRPPWRPGQSGNVHGRGAARARAIELAERLADDFGGMAALTALDRAQIETAAKLLLKVDREKNAAQAVKLSSEARRLLQSLRKRAPQARAPTQTLQEYLASKAQRPADAPEGEAA